jgi:hypothetical protein
MNPEHPEPSVCQDCGMPDLLDAARVCPSCATERRLDMEQEYGERVMREDREWWDRYALQPTDAEGK